MTTVPGSVAPGPRHARRDPPPEPSPPSGVRRWLPALAAALSVVGVIAVTLWQLHPNLLMQNSTATGGDTGAHVMMPAALESLLAHGHLTGWSPQWYDGYPIYTFYFVVPDLLVALAAKLIAYNVAFKWVTVLGSITLPIAIWACARWFGLRRPLPGVLAAAALPFLFDYTWTIYGGNLFSTLAGEYAYSLSLTMAIVFLGLFASVLRTGRHRAWCALALAVCILSHIVPAMFALAGALVLTGFELLPRRWVPDDARLWGAPSGSGPPVAPRGRTLWNAGCTLAVGLLLSGWWLVPFGLGGPYTTAMGYANLNDLATQLLPRADWWALVLAGLGVVVACVVRSRFGLLFAALAGLTALALTVDPQGRLYNARFLPLWFLCVYLLAAWAFGGAVVAVARWVRREPLGWVRRLPGPPALSPQPNEPEASPLPAFPRPASLAGTSFLAGSSSASAAAWFGPAAAGRPRTPAVPVNPGGPGEPGARRRRTPGATIGPLLALAGVCLVVVPPFIPSLVAANVLPVQPGPNRVAQWAHNNYVGYQGQPSYPEYRAVMAMMRRVGEREGCGRAMWEYNPDLGRFGTPEALMLLPYWTGGCIDSMEGLLFESSATTPYHFLDESELSVAPWDPMVGLPYGPVDVTLGIEHLQLLGARYFMATSPAIQQAAAADPSLELVGSSGPFAGAYGTQKLDTTWDVFEVRNSALVVPLSHLPDVLRDIGPAQTSWLAPSVAWYDNPAAWSVELAQSGPANWPRVRVAGSRPAIGVPATTVRDVHQTDESVSFSVSRLGTPILVRVSYFPNWHARGAAGPWRVTPNLMVVVPTSHQVTLFYGTTGANEVGLVCAIFGAIGLLALAVGSIGSRARHRLDPQI